ncbi:MAG: homoserine dehydrogenase, partial [Chloroflexi bacterium]|nr:homoserine dehydrogenase [Chloroflexota bacterium]
MQTVRLALIGFGNVGQGLAQILLERGNSYAEKQGLRFMIVAVNDLVRGCAFDPQGLDLADLLQAKDFSNLPGGAADW